MTLMQDIYPSFSTLLTTSSLVLYFPFLRAVFKQEHPGKYMWWISLAVSDILVALNVFLYAHKFYDHFGEDAGCQIVAFLSLSFGFVNIANVALIAYEKQSYVISKTKTPKTTNSFLLLAMWSLSSLTGSLPFVGVGQFEKKQEGHVTCLLDLHSISTMFYVCLVAVVWFAIPVILMIRSYYEVYRKSKENRMLSILGPGVLIFCYLPFAIHCLMTVLFGTHAPVGWAQIITILPKLLSVINPIVYTNFDPDLKLEKPVDNSSNGIEKKED